jgi:hypothetical protein
MSFHDPQTVFASSNLDVEMHVCEIPITGAPIESHEAEEETVDDILKKLQWFTSREKSWMDEGTMTSSDKIAEFHNYMDKHAEFMLSNPENEAVQKCTKLEKYQLDRANEVVYSQQRRLQSGLRPFVPFKIDLDKLHPIVTSIKEVSALEAMRENEGVASEEYYNAVKKGTLINEHQRRMVIDWLFDIGSQTVALRNTILFAIIYFDLVMKIHTETVDTVTAKTFMRRNGQLIAAACLYRAQSDGVPLNQLSSEACIFACDSKYINRKIFVSGFKRDPDDETDTVMTRKGMIDSVWEILVVYALKGTCPSYTVADFVEYFLFGFFDLTTEYEKNPKESEEQKRVKEDYQYFCTTMILLDRACMDIEWVLYPSSLLAATAFRLMTDVYINRANDRKMLGIPDLERTKIKQCATRITADVFLATTREDSVKCHQFLSKYYDQKELTGIMKDAEAITLHRVASLGRSKQKKMSNGYERVLTTIYEYLAPGAGKINNISPSG